MCEPLVGLPDVNLLGAADGDRHVVEIESRSEMPLDARSPKSHVSSTPDSHTVKDTVITYGRVLVDDPNPLYAKVRSLGVDDVLFLREGEHRTQRRATHFVEVRSGQTLDVLEGRGASDLAAALRLERRRRCRDLRRSGDLTRARRWRTPAQQEGAADPDQDYTRPHCSFHTQPPVSCVFRWLVRAS